VVLSYGPTAGYGPLRETIAAEMSRKGAACDASSILVTNGSQQALELAFRAFVDPGDAVVVEDPTYTGAISALAALGARLVGVPLDDQGLRPELLELALERPGARSLRAAHVPQPHRTGDENSSAGTCWRSPRATAASSSRRLCLDLRFAGAISRRFTPWTAGSVLYLNTFSEKLPGLHRRLGARPSPSSSGCSRSNVETAAQALVRRRSTPSSPRAAGRHLARVRSAYLSSRWRWTKPFDPLPRGAAVHGSSGGLFSWVSSPGRRWRRAVRRRERGVLVGRGSLFHVSGGGRNACG
jgi:DNA-binding transcriptional MocR family regulator